MDNPSARENILQALHEHGILDRNGNASGQKHGEITIDLLWALYTKVARDLDSVKETKNKEIHELQKYVENVRLLSDERDRLNTEFDKGNEALKEELKELKKNQLEQEERITEMCREEKIPELIGNAQTEQIAYLMLVRSNLLKKLEVTEKDLRSEDSELRDRMNNAMAEMGGMASKLTEALQERDRLKREVAKLNQTLSLVNGLPSQNVNNMEAKTQILALENSVNYYVGQIGRLTGELEKCKSHNRSRKPEIMTELEDLKEMNTRFKDVNSEFNTRLETENDTPSQKVLPSAKRSTSVDSYLLPESHQRLQVKSKKLISQMEVTLEFDSKQAEEKDRKHHEEMSRMEEKIKELREIIRQNEKTRKQLSKISNIDYLELKSQLAETNRQYKVVKAEEAECRDKCHKFEREFTKAQASWKQCERQLSTQTEISFRLKQRNDELELELAKISDVKQKHDKEIRELKAQSTKLKSYVSSESQRESEIQLNEVQSRLEIEKGKRFTAEEELESARIDLESAIRKRNDLTQELDDLQMKNDSLENRLLLINGKHGDILVEKMLEEMSREQLEEVTNVMKVRLLGTLNKSHDYAQKYISLKQKHRAKIRKIRDLFMLERRATAEEVEKFELRVVLAESALEQELSWKQKAINDVRRAEEEQRKAIRREDEARKSAEDRSIELIQAIDKYRSLNDENRELQSQLGHLESQKKEIERLARKEHQKKELNTLLSSLSLSGSQSQDQREKINATDAMTLDESGFNETSNFPLERTGCGKSTSPFLIKQGNL